MGNMENKLTVAVTGASGYIASWVVKKLLDHGHVVHGTVRDTENEDKVGHLKKQGVSHDGRLRLFKADLLEGGFEEAFEGCDVVVHMASPFLIGKVSDPENQLLRPALEGTERVLNAVNASASVKHVVLTSSVVSIFNDAIEAAELPDNTFTAEHWNQTSSLDYQPYNYSKMMAEKKAWELCENQDRWKMTVVNPAFVLGPSLSKRSDGASIDFMSQMLRGDFKMGAPLLYYGIVDVRDVAETHVHAIEREHPSGRYISVNEVQSLLEMANTIQSVTENVEYPLPTKKLPTFLLYIFGPLRGFSWNFIKKNVGHKIQFDNAPARNKLGVRFRSIEETYRDMVLQMDRDNII
ncbi:NAD-dependent epimerase/dehydratase family protein [Phaeocystidibacter luteus]|uniref:NAD-dependent epimerase/dehydratase family protein n=2 Tax=Phaeocystidibacter luteus TaxID=911197 RepID=A0A6N6RG25_9FLAO|nr:NAD-dependent epimerase/dehydratase family protein [Phaeocystidibacter luteus]